MARTQVIRKEEAEPTQPVNIGDRALDNLKFIRETMERSTVFTSVPGYGGILMGATAIVAAYIAHSQASIRDWLTVWLTEAVLAFFIGLLAMWQKTKISKTSMFSTPARKLVMNSLPPALCGVFITLGLWRFGHFEVMIPVWILCYGAAVVCGGAFSVKTVPLMGWCFIALGAIAFFLPANTGQLMMGLSFGVLHIVFGSIIGRKFGG
ncbi:MAG TPA: hypothetical protein VNB22_14295 [Pyrinomonadaceae bacterium]|jgi:hypothetical protein|nr:hypothetical protein [Pyrinomonadaceae bacterium]